MIVNVHVHSFPYGFLHLGEPGLMGMEKALEPCFLQAAGRLGV